MAKELVLIPRLKYETLLSGQEKECEKTQKAKEEKPNNTDLNDKVMNESTIDSGSVNHDDVKVKGDNRSTLNQTISSEPSPKLEDVELKKKSKRNPLNQSGGKAKKQKYVRQTFSDFLSKQRPSQQWITYKI